MIILGCSRCPKKFDGYDIKKLEEEMSYHLMDKHRIQWKLKEEIL